MGTPHPRGGHRGRAHRARARKRAAVTEMEGHRPRAAAYAKHAAKASTIETSLNPKELPVQYGAYRAGVAGAKELYGSKKKRGLEEFLRLGFQRIGWNGMPLVNATGRVFGVLAGRPNKATYAAHILRAFSLLNAAARTAAKGAPSSHRRGLFAAVTVGISYGQGQTGAASLEGEYPELCAQLVGDDSFQEIASFGSAMLAFWAPRLYQYYRDCNAKLDPTLGKPRPFRRSVFAAATFNLGPNVWTFKHRDVLNLPFGWCAITALGDFDHTKGGHLVLWELKLIIEFPPGATILIPSATIAHSNVPVDRTEHRCSFTQYTAGGLFRYADNGLRTEAELAVEDPEMYDKLLAEKDVRWQKGVDLWSTLEELVELAETMEPE
ncbi:hypothetical protein GGX14DRAFT_396703 [Mycena pura]|uniref:Uncharacterized protein n=1 Tax=Mycena pura TaxID=153505 RepID=A0AAD6V9Q8_9AGAR|nr:hypothetical protein GGX14DRAFT_396703 [Mycena pura]